MGVGGLGWERDGKVGVQLDGSRRSEVSRLEGIEGPPGREDDTTLVAALIQRVCSAPCKLDRLKPDFSANLSWLGAVRDRMKPSQVMEAQKAFAEAPLSTTPAS